jgi:hypothetical protein
MDSFPFHGKKTTRETPSIIYVNQEYHNCAGTLGLSSTSNHQLHRKRFVTLHSSLSGRSAASANLRRLTKNPSGRQSTRYRYLRAVYSSHSRQVPDPGAVKNRLQEQRFELRKDSAIKKTACLHKAILQTVRPELLKPTDFQNSTADAFAGRLSKST